MTLLTLVLAAALAVGAVVLVALPYLREPKPADDRLDTPDEQRLALAEERDRALAALKELEFDHRTGKVGDADYRELLGPLRRAAARALKDIDRQQRYGESMTDFETPDLPPEPYPPPDEGTPPTPPEVPEPYPPPDELTPPTQPLVPEPGPQE